LRNSGLIPKKVFDRFDKSLEDDFSIQKFLKTEIRLRFHDLRHTAATRMVERGIELVVVKEILGHSDINTTMIYAHPVKEVMLKAVKVLNDY
jgi:site-specific recombinase XerD